MGPFLEKACREHGLDMILFMLTNIIEESTEMLCYGQDCAELVESAFPPAKVADNAAVVPGVVSRKKQVVPALMWAISPQQRGVEDEIRKEKNGGDGPSGLEAWKYAVPSPGGDGKLRPCGRASQYYYGGLDRDGVQFSCHGVHFRKAGAAFLSYDPGIGRICDKPYHGRAGAGRGLLRRAVRPGCG